MGASRWATKKVSLSSLAFYSNLSPRGQWALESCWFSELDVPGLVSHVQVFKMCSSPLCSLGRSSELMIVLCLRVAATGGFLCGQVPASPTSFPGGFSPFPMCVPCAASF